MSKLKGSMSKFETNGSLGFHLKVSRLSLRFEETGVMLAPLIAISVVMQQILSLFVEIHLALSFCFADRLVYHCLLATAIDFPGQFRWCQLTQ